MIPHKKYMQMAIALAKKGDPSPLPRDGCIIVKRGQIIGRGYRKDADSLSAVGQALEQAQHKAKDSIMYVVVEPGSLWGKEAPPTERIVMAGVREVVIAMHDPDAKVEGYEILKQRGVKTRIGILEKEGKQLNAPYLKVSKKRLPLVTLLCSLTPQDTVQPPRMRGRDAKITVDGIKDDAGVVMTDAGSLSRDRDIARNRTAIIIDPQLRTGPRSLMAREGNIFVCSERVAQKKKDALIDAGVRILATPTNRGMVDLRKALRESAKDGINGVVIHGNKDLCQAAMHARVVDQLIVTGTQAPDTIAIDTKHSRKVKLKTGLKGNLVMLKF